MTPTPGRIVTYCDLEGAIQPAIVQFVDPEEEFVDLWVFGPEDIYKVDEVKRGEDEGEWEWPLRVGV